MTKIAYIIDNLQVSGAQVHLLRLVKALEGRMSVELICLGDVDTDFVSASGVKDIRRVSMASIRKPGVWWRGFLDLVQILRDSKPDIVHTYLNTSNVFGVLAAKIAGVRIILTSRRDMGHFRSYRIGLLEKFINSWTEKVLCVSEAVRNAVIASEQLGPEKTGVIYTGVDVNEFYKTDKAVKKSYFTVGLVAAISREIKGHRYFIEAAEKVSASRKNVKFVLIGDGPLKRPLEEYVSQKGIKGYFDFKGSSSDVKKELETVDIFVMPSLSEGFSNAILEAMSMNIPVIATAVEGNLEAIEDGVSGFLVPAKDAAAIANKILELINHPRLIVEMGEAARKRVVDHFSIEAMTKNYLSFYEKLVGQRKSNIGYVVSLFPCWSETFIVNEMRELERKGADITIFSVRSDLEKFTQESAKPFIKKTRYPNAVWILTSALIWLIKKPLGVIRLVGLIVSGKHKSLKELFKSFWCLMAGLQFAGIAKKNKISHLHAHFATYPALTALVMSTLTKIPFTFTAHAHDIFLDKPFLKEIAKEAKGIIAISDYNKNYIADYCDNGIVSKIKVIHCGIDPHEYQSSTAAVDKAETVIISIGRLTEMKGFKYLIKACSLLSPKISFKCHIIGDGPLRNELISLIGKLGLQRQIFLEGVLDSNRIKEFFGKATVFVLPSVWSDKDGQDGIPLVLMEAMAAGVPVIASRISGIPELVKDKETGLLVEPRHDAGLATAIMELFNDRQLRQKLSLNGRATVNSDFNIVKSSEQLLEVFCHG